MAKVVRECDGVCSSLPFISSSPRDVGEHEFIERTHTIYNPMDRLDYYVIWNHRRGREGSRDYRGGLMTLVGYLGFLAPTGTDFTYHSEVPYRLVLGLGEDGQKIKAGTVMKYRFVMGTFVDREAGNTQLEHVSKALNLGGGHDGYPVAMKAGEISDATFFFTVKAKKNEAVFTLGPQRLPIDLPIRVQGLDDNGCVAVSSTVRPWFRFVPLADGFAHLQEPIDAANELWVGNVFVSDNKNVKLTLVVDGQSEGKPPFLEIHNPTGKPVKTRIWSPKNTPQFGGQSKTVNLPVGDSLRLVLKNAPPPL